VLAVGRYERKGENNDINNLKEIGLWVWILLKLGIGSSGVLGRVISQKNGYVTEIPGLK